MDYSPRGSTVLLSQARILQWVAFSFSSRPRDQNCISHGSCLAGGLFGNCWEGIVRGTTVKLCWCHRGFYFLMVRLVIKGVLIACYMWDSATSSQITKTQLSTSTISRVYKSAESWNISKIFPSLCLEKVLTHRLLLKCHFLCNMKQPRKPKLSSSLSHP